jgi:hypothetical protein
MLLSYIPAFHLTKEKHSRDKSTRVNGTSIMGLSEIFLFSPRTPDRLLVLLCLMFRTYHGAFPKG